MSSKVSTILTIGSLIGLGVTAFFVAKETPAANEAIRSQGNNCDKKDIIIESAKEYEWAIVAGATTAALIIASRHIDAKNIAALSAAYSAIGAKYYQNRSKIDGIKEKIIQSDTKSKKDATTVPSENDSRFYQKHWYQEEYSGKVFEASEKEIMEAILELNKQLQLNGYVTLQEFLKFFNVDYLNDKVGWSLDNLVLCCGGYCWLDIDYSQIYNNPNDELSFDLNINNGQETSLLVFGICPNADLYHEENDILNSGPIDY